jgi:hypothetical protein
MFRSHTCVENQQLLEVHLCGEPSYSALAVSVSSVSQMLPLPSLLYVTFWQHASLLHQTAFQLCNVLTLGIAWHIVGA